jgi:hypothetical protein
MKEIIGKQYIYSTKQYRGEGGGVEGGSHDTIGYMSTIISDSKHYNAMGNKDAGL